MSIFEAYIDLLQSVTIDSGPVLMISICDFEEAILGIELDRWFRWHFCITEVVNDVADEIGAYIFNQTAHASVMLLCMQPPIVSGDTQQMASAAIAIVQRLKMVSIPSLSFLSIRF